MNISPTCPKCKVPLPANTVRGLCPKCLALVAMESGSEDKTIVVAPPRVGSLSGPALSSSVHYFGDYELLDEIARGGMGVVFKARQVSLNRRVAVKMILGGQLATEADVQRFRTEAEAAANLQHPNIVAIHEIGEHEGRHYFSMDLIEGTDLAKLTHGDPMAVAKAAQYVKIIAEAIHYAHQQGTLHRDLKPHNVLIDQHDQPRITDFGLAKLTRTNSSITQEGTVMGSPSYMPPEQAEGRQAEVGPHSDIYSIGAVLYHLLTGKAPFAAETPVATLQLVVDSEPIAPSTLNPKVPADLETICLKCLEKHPERRYASAKELAEELGRFLNFEPILARPASKVRRVWNWSQRNPWALVAACGLMMMIFACVAYGFWEKSRFLASRLEMSREVSPIKAEPQWEMALSRQTAPAKNIQPTKVGSPALFFLNVFPFVYFLLYFAGKAFRKACRRHAENGAPFSDSRLFVHGGLGVAATTFSLGYLLMQIRSWVWSTAPSDLLVVEILNVIVALVMGWIAFRMVWEAVGMHETSRFRGVVDQALERQSASAVGEWSVFKLAGFAAWLCVLGVVLTVAIVGVFSSNRDLDLLVCVISTLTAGGLTALVEWILRRRLRLFTFLFAPLALIVWAAGLGVLYLNVKLQVDSESWIVGGGSALLLASWFCFFKRRNKSLSAEPEPFPVNPWIDAVLGLAFLIVVFVLFHVVENWRGRREWARVQADLIAKGEKLDFAAFLKPPIPNDENAMEHPYMKQYFLRNSLLQGSAQKKLPVVHPIVGAMENDPFRLTDLQKLPRQNESPRSISDLVENQPGTEVLSNIQLAGLPLSEALSNLAQRAGLNIVVSTNRPPWIKKETKPRPLFITRTFTNTTAIQALDILCQEHQLAPSEARWQKDHVLFLKAIPPASLQTILDWYAGYRNDFTSFEEALQRPGSRLKNTPDHPYGFMANFVSFRMMAQTYATLCKVHLLLGDPDTALKKLKLLRRMVDAVQANEPPNIVEAMIGGAIAGLYAKTVEETLAAGLWPASFLEPMQKLNGEIDLLSNFNLSLRGGEVPSLIRWMQTVAQQDKIQAVFNLGTEIDYSFPPEKWLMGSLVPAGWVDQNIASYARRFQGLLDGLDAAHQRLDPSAIEAGTRNLEQEWERRPLSFYNFLAALAIPNIAKATQTTARNQTLLNQVYLACALERFRAARGNYPETIEALVPEFATALPHDLFTGEALRYRRTASDKFMLYSVGWNLKDDKGEKALDDKREWSSNKGDWIWQGVPKK